MNVKTNLQEVPNFRKVFHLSKLPNLFQETKFKIGSCLKNLISYILNV